MSNFTMKFSAPLFVHYKTGRTTKKFYVNLNEYRNAHYQVLSKVKKVFQNHILYMAPVERTGNKSDLPVKITFTLYAGDKKSRDLANVCSIVDKFACDALVKGGVLEDDNCDNITNVQYIYGGIDRDNPRVDVYIEETKQTNQLEKQNGR